MPEPAGQTPLGAEDAKLIVLARAARVRAYAPYGGVIEGAAVRDTDGRTYAAATVQHKDERLASSALRGALSAFASSGARTLEAVALVHDRTIGIVCADDLMLVAEFGADVPIIVAALDGTVLTTVVPATLLGAS
jgi:cytidine deaminase